VARLADTVVVVMVPGLGDEVQKMVNARELLKDVR
jgi:putative protein kinase ArgK-like GTPase of G3E family